MYPFLLFFHSVGRWLVLATLLYAIARACRGFFSDSGFTKSDNMARHWAEVAAQMQFTLGFVLYFISPLVKYFFTSFGEANQHTEAIFFGIVHIGCMVASVFLITFGSASVKRKQTDKEKFRTMLLWFSLALLVICIAIPWPFSPLAHRPYFRAF